MLGLCRGVLTNRKMPPDWFADCTSVSKENSVLLLCFPVNSSDLLLSQVWHKQKSVDID